MAPPNSCSMPTVVVDVDQARGPSAKACLDMESVLGLFSRKFEVTRK